MLSSEAELKDFMEQLNDLLAPVTRAYSDPQILSLEVAPGDVQETEATVRLVVKVKRNAYKSQKGV